MAAALDASVVVAAFLPRERSEAAVEFLEERLQAGEQFVAPPLLYAETTSVLRRYVHRQRIRHDEAVIALQDLLAMPIRVVADSAVYLRALELAHRLGHARAYDVQYLAVAQMHDCPVVTLDRGLYESARALNIAAHLIE